LADAKVISTYRLLIALLQEFRPGEEEAWPFIVTGLGNCTISL